MKHALEEELWIGLNSERQKMFAVCRNTLKMSLKDFSVSVMRWIGSYAWEEDCASQTDALQSCSDPQRSYNQTCASDTAWIISSALLQLSCNSNTGKLSKQTAIYYTVQSEQWRSAVTGPNNLNPRQVLSPSVSLTPWGTFEGLEIANLNYSVILCAVFPDRQAATKHHVTPLQQSLLKAHACRYPCYAWEVLDNASACF